MENKHTRFAELAARRMAPYDDFPAAVAEFGWRLIVPGEALYFPEMGSVLVIGVALWSPPDLKGLDVLAERTQDRTLPVFIFNIDEFASIDALARVMPGVATPVTTPIVALYHDRRLIRSDQGKPALEWLAEL